MHLIDLALLYAALGILTTFYLRWRQRVKGWARAGEWIMTTLFWPFALALALSAPGAKVTSSPHSDPAERALGEAFEAVQGSNLESLLPESAVTRLRSEIQRSRSRLDELSHVVQTQGLTVERVRAHVAELERKGASERTLGSARLQLDNAMRLSDLCQRDTQVLEELTELLRVLRAQLVLARYAGSAPAGIADVVTEVWARVEVLGISLEPSDGTRQFIPIDA